MTEEFKLLMIGAMYENGGNTTHRFLDGHERFFVYPFESQLGTRMVSDPLTATFPVKYRWPVFALDATPEADYAAIIDEECKVRARTPDVSKFRRMPFDLSDDERRELYVQDVRTNGRSTASNVAAFYRATFRAWRDHRSTGREDWYVGYSPIITVDAEQILRDLPASHFLHVVRNPWSAYADTKRRPVPLPLDAYMLGWTITQRYALMIRDRFPDRMHILRFEDIVQDPTSTLGGLCDILGVARSESLSTPSWNSKPLDEIYPWGTIRHASPPANGETARELTAEETARVREGSGLYAIELGYADFLRK